MMTMIMTKRMMKMTRKEPSEKFKAYQLEYYKRPEVKEQRRNYYNRYNKIPENREKILNYMKEYNKKPEVKERCSAYAKRYRATSEGQAKIHQSRCVRILKKHHEELSHDPEHLTTEFIASLVGCKCSRIAKNGV